VISGVSFKHLELAIDCSFFYLSGLNANIQINVIYQLPPDDHCFTCSGIPDEVVTMIYRLIVLSEVYFEWEASIKVHVLHLRRVGC